MYVSRLINSSSNCYMNSTLQGLAACPQLIEDFAQLENECKNINSLTIFNKLFRIITTKSSKVNALQNDLFKNWKKRGQQDSFELLTYAINEVYRELRKQNKLDDIEQWLNFKLPMRIIMGYDIECCNHHSVKCPKQVALALHVPFTNNLEDNSIQILVNKYLEETEIEDYICDECKEGNLTNNQKNGEVRAKKISHILSPLPHTICIHLQRTRWIRGAMKKLSNSVTIDEKLNISYLDNNNKSASKTFSLKSIIVHHGSAFFGHYVCYRQCDSKWYFTSDSYVKEVNIQAVMSSEPYILFYE